MSGFMGGGGGSGASLTPAANMVIGPSDAHYLSLQANGAEQVYIDGSGVINFQDNVLVSVGNPTNDYDAANKLYVDSKVPLVAPVGLRIVSNATTPNTKVDYSVRYAVLAGSSSNKAFTGSGTINTATVGANGLDAGTQAANTLYYLWLIGKSDGTFAGLLSTSSTAPTMPTGYTYKFLASWVVSDASVHFLPMRQQGSTLSYDKWQDVISTSFVGSANTLFDLNAALAYPVIGTALSRRVYLGQQSPGTALGVSYGPGDSLGTPGVTPMDLYMISPSNTSQFGWANTDSLGKIRYFCDAGGGSSTAFLRVQSFQIEWF